VRDSPFFFFFYSQNARDLSSGFGIELFASEARSDVFLSSGHFFHSPFDRLVQLLLGCLFWFNFPSMHHTPVNLWLPARPARPPSRARRGTYLCFRKRGTPVDLFAFFFFSRAPPLVPEVQMVSCNVSPPLSTSSGRPPVAPAVFLFVPPFDP